MLKATSPDFSKCMSKFPSKFNSIETSAGPGICPSEGDGSSIDGWITRDANDNAVLLAGGVISRVSASGQTTSYGAGDDGDQQPGVSLQYVDNGDGTVTDTSTGLMWEKKIQSTGGYTPCADETGTCANPHHADNAYSWGAVAAPPYDGRAITIFLAQLNDRCDQDTTVSCSVDADCAVPGGACGFAGHQGWRLPTIKELQSIVDYAAIFPSVGVAFNGASCGPARTDITDPACSCTTSSYYWSSTTSASSPTFAWRVYFDDGDVDFVGKGIDFYVRAVRGVS